jgi:hypothetical protein
LDYFSQSFSSTGHLEAFGNFLSSDKEYRLDIKEDSWFRMTCEPLNHAAEVSIWMENTEIQKAKAQAGGTARLGVKLASGIYSIKLAVQGSGEMQGSNTAACEEPNWFLNLAVASFGYLDGIFRDFENGDLEFPDLSEAFSTFNTTASFFKTFPSVRVPVAALSKNLIKKYSLSVPKIGDLFKDFGYTGLWQVTFALRNT